MGESTLEPIGLYATKNAGRLCELLSEIPQLEAQRQPVHLVLVRSPVHLKGLAVAACVLRP